jgi:hypothetical protein
MIYTYEQFITIIETLQGENRWRRWLSRNDPNFQNYEFSTSVSDLLINQPVVQNFDF